MTKILQKTASAVLAAAIIASPFSNIGYSAFAAETETKTVKGLWLTELYPNDVKRSAVYGSSGDLMEFVEITNTSNEAINFNNEYELDYEYPSGSTYTLKKLLVTNTDGESDVVIGAGETVVLWSYRPDIDASDRPTEAEFRAAMNISNDIQVLLISGQNGFAEDNRGFAIRSQDGTLLSHFRYTTDVDTSDGLAVHLEIPDYGSEMLACETMKPTSAGLVYSNQLNGQNKFRVPTDLAPKGVYITEIRPNDSNRDAEYGSGDNDMMECLELTNTTNQDIDLNKSYKLFYYIKKGSSKELTICTPDRTSDKCTIPAGGTAVLWCDRQDSFTAGTDYERWPTEAEFRSAYSVPDSTPVYVCTNQNGLGNTARGFELYKLNADSTTSLVSYYFWDGVNDLKDNKSVVLRVNPEGPKMSVYAAQAASTIGMTVPEQLTYAADDGSSPTLKLMDDSTTIEQGSFMRIPYAFEGTDTMPVTSLSLFYKTSNMTAYAKDKTTSFAIYNKYYAFIPSDVLLNAEYVDYYVKASNAYRNTMTEIRRMDIQKINNTTGLHVNLNGKSTESSYSDTVSGKLAVTTKNCDDTAAPITLTLDNQPLTTTTSLENGAFYTFSYTGVDSYFKNALTCGDEVIQLFARCSEIPSDSSMAIHVDSTHFTYNEDGTASIELVIRPGTYGSTWESDNDANNDDFTISNVALSLPDGTVVSPSLFTDENGNTLDPTATIKMGDSSGRIMQAKALFTIPADKIDAAAASIDTTALSDGTHTLVATSGQTSKTVTFTSNNSKPAAEPEETPVNVNMDMTVTAAAYPASATVTPDKNTDSISVYNAEVLTDMKVYEGTGDSTADAVEKSGSAPTVSDDGKYPYQIYEITAGSSETNQMRFDITANADYEQPVQLYALNTVDNVWELLDTTKNGDVTTAIFALKNRLKDGKATILVQARGDEYAPTTEPDTLTSKSNDYVWNGTAAPEQYDFSMAWITDTQYYSEQYMDNFKAMTNWIVDNQKTYDIEYVMHTGDIVDEFNEEYESINSSREMKKFEDAGIPYGVLGGNHDVAHGNERYDLYWKYFGQDRYENYPYYGDGYKNNLGHYDLVTVDEVEMIFVYMSWDIQTPETDWINSVLEQYPDRKAFLCIHGGINASAEQSYFSDLLLENVCKTHSNVLAILNGHYHGSSLNFVGFDDNGDGTDDRAVYQICTDYQSAPGGGEGYIKMMYFDLKNDKIYMNSYSPVLDDINYFDTPKLDSYGIGTVASDIDITELAVDFDRDTDKSLTTAAASAALLTNQIVGGSAADGKTTIPLSVEEGSTKTVYAVGTDAKGNITAYSNAVTFTLDNHSETPDSDTTTDDSTDTTSSTSSSTAADDSAISDDKNPQTGNSGTTAGWLLVPITAASLLWILCTGNRKKQNQHS